MNNVSLDILQHALLNVKRDGIAAAEAQLAHIEASPDNVALQRYHADVARMMHSEQRMSTVRYMLGRLFSDEMEKALGEIASAMEALGMGNSMALTEALRLAQEIDSARHQAWVAPACSCEECTDAIMNSACVDDVS